MSAPEADQTETLRLIRAAGRKAGITFGVPPDDVVQDLWMLYNSKLAALYSPTLSLYPLLAEAARRIALGHTHRRYREVTQSDLAEADGEDIIADLPTETDPIEEADRAIALATLGKMITPTNGADPCLGLNRFAIQGDQEVESSASPRRTKKPRSERSLSSNQIRLREIRQRLRMTLREFAINVGATEASQRAYEYGVTRDVPADVMRRAEQLAESVASQRTRQRPALLDKPIDELFLIWAERLGVEPDPAVMAEAMNNLVSGNTLRRWLAKKHTPAEQNLLAVNSFSRFGPRYLDVEKAKTLWRMVANSSHSDGRYFIPEETFHKLLAVLATLATSDGYIGEASRTACLLLQEIKLACSNLSWGIMNLPSDAFRTFAERMKNSVFWQE